MLSSASTQATRRGAPRLGALLVGAEVGLSLIVLTTGALFVGSFLRLMAVDTGFDRRNLVAFRASETMVLGGPPQAEFEPTAQTLRMMLDEVRQSPGVLGAALADGSPFSALGRTAVGIPNRPGRSVSTQLRGVSDGYFGTVGMTMHAGREFASNDDHGGRPVAIVSEQAARTWWPGESAIGA